MDEDTLLRSREEEDDSLDGSTLPAHPSSRLAADDDDAREAQEILAMKARVAEMEKEAAMLRQMTAQAESDANAASSANANASPAPGAPAPLTDDEKEAIDSRSVYVGNVDYASTPEEIQAHFAACGTINRVTILFDKFTGPKGYAYVEFADPSLVANAVLLNESMFRGRLLKVTPKRTNVPGLGAAARGRGRGRGRGGYRGGYQGYHGGYQPYSRPRGRGGYRGRGS